MRIVTFGRADISNQATKPGARRPLTLGSCGGLDSVRRSGRPYLRLRSRATCHLETRSRRSSKGAHLEGLHSLPPNGLKRARVKVNNAELFA
jgi:hypothetical protein